MQFVRPWLCIFMELLLPGSGTPASPESAMPPGPKYNILMLLPFSPPSHRNWFLPLAEALGQRGHSASLQVTILSSLLPENKHPNVREINHGINVMASNQTMFDIRKKKQEKGFQFFEYILPKLAREIYDHPDVKEIYGKRNEFDLIIIDELFNEPAYPFLEGRKYATIASAGVLSTTSATIGNVLNPSYIPYLIVEYLRPFSFIQRLTNLAGHLMLPIYWRKITIFPAVEKELLAHFPSLPPLVEIEKGLSLVLVNSHFALDFPMPLLPSQVEVGGMHCRPGKPRPKDIQSFIEGAGPEGVIYFSLGSFCEGKTIPEEYKLILIEAFKTLKMRVIWKFEEDFKDLPDNILIKKWLPQQDVLAHPKVTLFITHGGISSMQEAIYHGTPLLALPIFGDQERNGQRIQNKGFGKILLWEELTIDLLVSTVRELVDNPKYLKQIQDASASFRDQPTTPLEKAVWWTEYVIRHKGAPQLKSPAADLSWIEYLMVDVILAIHFVIFLAYMLLKKLFRFIASMGCKKSKSDSSQKKKKKALTRF